MFNIKIIFEKLFSIEKRIDFIGDHIQKIVASYPDDHGKQANEIKKFLVQQGLYYSELPEINQFKIMIDSLLRKNKQGKTESSIKSDPQKILKSFESYISNELVNRNYSLNELENYQFDRDVYVNFGDALAHYLTLILPGSMATAAILEKVILENDIKIGQGKMEKFYGKNAADIEKSLRDAGLITVQNPLDDIGPFPSLSQSIFSLSKKYHLLIEERKQIAVYNRFIEWCGLNHKIKKLFNKIDFLVTIRPNSIKFKVYKAIAIKLQKIGFTNENRDSQEASIAYFYDIEKKVFIRLIPKGKKLVLPGNQEAELNHRMADAGNTLRVVSLNSLVINNLSICVIALNFELPEILGKKVIEKKSKEILLKAVEANEMFKDILDKTIKNHIEQKKQERILVAAVGREAVDNLKKTGNFGQTEKRDMYNHFADLVGFTDMSEKLHPELTGMIMNDFFDRMYRVMEKHGVTIDKFVGDQTMSQIHKKDMSIKDQTIKMFELSVDMVKEINEFNKILVEHYLPKEVQIDPLRIRIGFYHGEVIFGPFGRKGKMDYTAIGKPVNTAARYQSAAHPNHLVISEEAYQILLEAGVVQKHFEEITQHTECDAYKNAEIDDIFVPTSQRMKGIEKPHDIRMVLLDASYPKMISDQINHYLKDPAKGAYRIADIIFGLNKSGYSETILETIDKIDFYMIEWLIKELSKKYKLQFDFARDQIDETIIEKMSAIKHYHDVLTLEQARNPIGRLKHMVELRKKIVKPIRDDGYYEKDSGERKDVAKVLNDDIERDHQLLHLKQYHREVKMSFVRQLIKHQQHYRITKSLMRNVNGSFSRYENIEDLIFKTLISLNGLIVNKTPQELVNILMQKIGHLTVEKQKKAYVKYFSQIIGKALFAGKLSAVGLEKVKKAVLVP